MSSLHTKRAAAAGLAGALALGTIASVGALSPAAAAEGTTTYTCTLSSGPVPLPVKGSLTLPTSVASGGSLSGLNSGMAVTLPAALVQGLGTALPGLASIGGTVSSFDIPFGDGALRSGSMALPQTKPGATGDLVMNSTGKTVAGSAGNVGTHEAFMPKSFSFTPTVVSTVLGTQTLDPIPCVAQSSPASLGTVTVTKATSKVVTKVTNAPVTPAKRAKVRVTVRSTATNAGKVLIKKGKTVLAKGTLSDADRKTLVLPKLKRGTHKLVAIYKGDANTKASKKAFDLVVKRG